MVDQVKCPNCGGTKISTEDVVKKEPVWLRALLVLMMVNGLAAVMWAEFPFDAGGLEGPLRLLGGVFGLWVIWDVLTGLPLPFTRLKLIKVKMITQHECTECGHQWLPEEVKE